MKFLDRVLWKQGCGIMYVYAFRSMHICSAERLTRWGKALQESQERAFVVDFPDFHCLPHSGCYCRVVLEHMNWVQMKLLWEMCSKTVH